MPGYENAGQVGRQQSHRFLYRYAHPMPDWLSNSGVESDAEELTA